MTGARPLATEAHENPGIEALAMRREAGEFGPTDGEGDLTRYEPVNDRSAEYPLAGRCTNCGRAIDAHADLTLVGSNLSWKC